MCSSSWDASTNTSTLACYHTHTHTHTCAPAHTGRHSGRVLSHSLSLHPALAGNLVPSANTRASQGGLKWGQGMSRGCWRSAWVQAQPCDDSTQQDYDPTPAPPQPEGPSCRDRRKWSPSITERCHFPSPLNPPGPQNPAHLPARPQPTRNHLLQSGQEEALPRGRACQPWRRVPHSLRGEDVAGVGWGPAGAAPGLAVLYGFLFLCDSTAHSYRDWSRGARRGQPAVGSDTQQRGPRRPGQWPLSPSTGC